MIKKLKLTFLLTLFAGQANLNCAANSNSFDSTEVITLHEQIFPGNDQIIKMHLTKLTAILLIITERHPEIGDDLSKLKELPGQEKLFLGELLLIAQDSIEKTHEFIGKEVDHSCNNLLRTIKTWLILLDNPSN